MSPVWGVLCSGQQSSEARIHTFKVTRGPIIVRQIPLIYLCSFSWNTIVDEQQKSGNNHSSDKLCMLVRFSSLKEEPGNLRVVTERHMTEALSHFPTAPSDGGFWKNISQFILMIFFCVLMIWSHIGMITKLEAPEIIYCYRWKFVLVLSLCNSFIKKMKSRAGGKPFPTNRNRGGMKVELLPQNSMIPPKSLLKCNKFKNPRCPQ